MTIYHPISRPHHDKERPASQSLTSIPKLRSLRIRTPAQDGAHLGRNVQDPRVLVVDDGAALILHDTVDFETCLLPRRILPDVIRAMGKDRIDLDRVARHGS